MDLHSRKRSRTATVGFTLIEVLVAISVMALLATMSWRGLDSMARSQEMGQTRADELLVMQAAFAQWRADLESLEELPATSPLDWNGRSLRLVRRFDQPGRSGLRVVAWTLRDGQWRRWQSAPVRTRTEWETAWSEAAIWIANPGDAQKRHEVAVLPIDEWQIFYFRGDAWTNPLSSDGVGGAAPPPTGVGSPTTAASLPDGLRLVLKLSPGQAASGTVTLDWVRPALNRTRS